MQLLSVVCPLPQSKLGLFEEWLHQTARQTRFPTELILVLDGGSRDVYAEAESLVRDHGWPSYLKILDPFRNGRPRYFNECVRDAVQASGGDHIAIIPPEIRIDDEEWLWKAQRPLVADGRCGLVLAFKDSLSKALQPYHLQGPSPSVTRFFVGMRRSLLSWGIPDGDREICFFWPRKAVETGNSVWVAPQIRFSVLEHEHHNTCRPSSIREEETDPESPSLTTQASSSVTTTEEGGSEDLSGLDAMFE